METALNTETGERFEIRIGRDRYDFDNHDGDRMRVMDEYEFVNLLQDRLGKSVSEIHQLLHSYKQSVEKI
jgi:hypothetical protein